MAKDKAKDRPADGGAAAAEEPQGGSQGAVSRSKPHVKAVPIECPRCRSMKRKVLRSARRPDEGAWFQGRWVRGIVRQRVLCLGCDGEYDITDVLKTDAAESDE